jgi:hypothetical protein
LTPESREIAVSVCPSLEMACHRPNIRCIWSRTLDTSASPQPCQCRPACDPPSERWRATKGGLPLPTPMGELLEHVDFTCQYTQLVLTLLRRAELSDLQETSNPGAIYGLRVLGVQPIRCSFLPCFGHSACVFWLLRARPTVAGPRRRTDVAAGWLGALYQQSRACGDNSLQPAMMRMRPCITVSRMRGGWKDTLGDRYKRP